MEPLKKRKSKSKESKTKTKKDGRNTSEIAFSDMDMTQWRDYDHIESDSLWLFDGRGRSNGHQLDYHGNCVPQILTQLLTRFTKKDDVLLDLFLGSGTSAIEALNLERKAIGVELKPELLEYVREKLENLEHVEQMDDNVQLINGNSADRKWTGKAIKRALTKLGRDEAQFLFLHPPYADIIRFSEAEQCLSNSESTEAFLDEFEKVARLGFEKLEPGRFAGLVIGDKYANSELIPLGFLCMERMNRAGFKTKSIIVKNITGNERGKGRQGNLWRYRALKGGFYIFKHEYVMVFQKPKSKRSAS